MTGNIIRSIVTVLLALVLGLNVMAVAPTVTQTANSTATLAAELGTTAS